ncbi:hypothetical protein DXG03_004342 [Asterophora parasitica]|uniref:Uncharacterized protein n=1 Tax=Asterophora parasitica TaxID=117018 RepID=A0A9P7G9R5_9AGAR|nr:hypothetical protein DXG03_004342 [Asterophora parasitica]
MRTLESLALSYHSTWDYFTLFLESPIDAPALRCFALRFVSELGLAESNSQAVLQLGHKIQPRNVNVIRLTELHLTHVESSRKEIYSLLSQCRATLDVCTLTVVANRVVGWGNRLGSDTAPVRSRIRTLTIHNPNNADYDAYLEHVEFPHLENLNIRVNGVATSYSTHGIPSSLWDS